MNLQTKNYWSKQDALWIPTEVSQQYEQLPSEVFRVDFNQKIGFHLIHVNEKFIFDYKVYGAEEKFINKVSNPIGKNIV